MPACEIHSSCTDGIQGVPQRRSKDLKTTGQRHFFYYYHYFARTPSSLIQVDAHSEVL